MNDLELTVSDLYVVVDKDRHVMKNVYVDQ